MRDLRKNTLAVSSLMLGSALNKSYKEKQRGVNMIGTQLQNKHNGRRITITEKVISDTGNIMFVADDKKYTVLSDHDMKHWFEVSTVRVNRKPKFMGEEE